MIYIWVMHQVHLRQLDLNLLLALDTLLDERHVTRAARRLGLSQSAMSHALGRLRQQLGDPLLVRTRQGMQPTERALALKLPLRHALEQLRQLLAAPTPFDPKSAQRTFVLCVSDYEALTLVRPLLRQLSKEAPGVDLRLRASPDPNATVELLARGEVDLVLKPLSKLEQVDGIYHQRLARNQFVVVARPGNPYVGKRLTLKRYVAAPHVLISPGGTARGVIDELLEVHGLTRRIHVTVPNFLVAPHFVAETDALLTLPERVAHELAPALGLELHALPLAYDGFDVDQIWHARTHEEPAHRYLRQRLYEAAAVKPTRARR